jgi:hypothetical protein
MLDGKSECVTNIETPNNRIRESTQVLNPTAVVCQEDLIGRLHRSTRSGIELDISDTPQPIRGLTMRRPAAAEGSPSPLRSYMSVVNVKGYTLRGYVLLQFGFRGRRDRQIPGRLPRIV